MAPLAETPITTASAARVMPVSCASLYITYRRADFALYIIDARAPAGIPPGLP
jgi:hypothetical protein